MLRMLALLSVALVGLIASRGEPVAADSPVAAPAIGLTADQRDRFAAALTALQAGQADQAAREFGDPVWASTPLHDYAALLLAQSLVRTGDLSAARAAAARAADSAPDGRQTPSALKQTAAVLSAAGDEAGAAGLYRRFVERYPEHPDAARVRLDLARSLLAERRMPEARRALIDLWLLAPATPEAADAAQQLKLLDARGDVGPRPSPKQRVERAERLLSAGAADLAGSEATALLDTGLPGDLGARALRIVADANRRSGKADAALAAVKRGLAEAPPDRRAPWLQELARLQQRRNRDQAIATLDMLVRDYPKSAEAAEALELKAHLLEAASRHADAEAVYQRLAEGYLDREEGRAALWRLGWSSWFRGSFGDAAARWARLASMPGAQARREAVAYWIGRAHERQGDTEPAARQFAQLAADGPRGYYGMLAARRGVPGEAARATQASLALTLPAEPREALDGDARFARVEALRSVGLGEFADEELDELARRALGEPRRLYAVSAVYMQESRYHLGLRILRRHFQPYARRGLATLPRAFWEMFYPMGFRAELTEAAGRASIDPLLVAAVVREESSFYPQARSRVGARGLMQLMPDTARPMVQARRLAFNNGAVLDDPAANLDIGAAFLAKLLREFGDVRLAAAAYNAGPARVRQWWAARRSDDLEVFVEQIPFNETRGYVKRVMLAWDEYRRLYGAASAAEPVPEVVPTVLYP